MTQHQMKNIADGLPLDHPRVYRVEYTHARFICNFARYYQVRSEDHARELLAFDMPGYTFVSAEVR